MTTSAERSPHGNVERGPWLSAVLAPTEVDATQEAVRADRRPPAHWQKSLVRILVALDATAAAAGVLVVSALVGMTGRPALDLPLAAAYPAFFLLACSSTRSYEPRFLGTGTEEFRRVTDAGVRLLALAAVLALALDMGAARPYVVLVLPVTVAISLAARCLARQTLRRQRAVGNCLHRIVVVGRERACAELVRRLRREPFAGFMVVGACIDTPQSSVVEGVPVIGSSSTIVDAVRRVGGDMVAVGAWSDLSQDDLRRLSWQLEGSGIDLVVAPSLTDVAGPRLHIRPVAGLPLLHVSDPEFTGGRRLLKSSFDRGIAGFTLLVLSPVLLSVSAAVRLTSSGPALFRQVRVGVDGKTFTMFKFRSMYFDAEARLNDVRELNEASDGLLFKIRDDPRVTPLGRFLRRFSLDELPQLINILRGDMSVVGPRPPLPSEVELYGDDVQRRLLVPPGLTGLWQVSGRSDLSWEESVRLDLHYVENWSLALDVMIILRTAFAVLARRGAY